MRYEQVWNAVDKLAKSNGLSPSGLAKKAGLDSTTFNKSKRRRPDGNKRFPSLESINKIITACNISFETFYKLTNQDVEENSPNSIPYIKYSSLEELETSSQDEIDFEQWNKIKFPDSKYNLYAIEIDQSTKSNFKVGTTLIVSKNSEIRRGDNIVVLYKDGTIFIGSFTRRTATTIEILETTATNKKDLTLDIKNTSFVNRILWASQ